MNRGFKTLAPVTVMWNRIDAVLFLIKDLMPEVLDNTPESRLKQVVVDAFGELFGRLNADLALRKVAESLRHTVDCVRSRMSKVKLNDQAVMPPVLWIRLAKEAGVGDSDMAMRQVNRWLEGMNFHKAIVVFRYLDPNKEKYLGPLQKVEGIGEARGFFASDLLIEKRTMPNWPYSHIWKTYAFSETDSKAKEPAAENSENTIDLTASSSGSKKPKITKPKGRKRRTLDDIRRSCGSNVVDALQQCLEKEVKIKNSVLSPKGRDRRLYDCDRSLDDLVQHLKGKYKALLVCSSSTLKSALPAFVSCPRGRPGGIS